METTYDYKGHRVKIIDVEVPFSNTTVSVMEVTSSESNECDGIPLYISLCSYTTMRGLNDLFFGVSNKISGTPIILRTKTLSELFNCSRVYLSEDLLRTMFNSLLHDFYLAYKITIPVTAANDYIDKIIKNFKRIRHYCEVTPVNNFINKKCTRGSSRNYQGFRNDIYDGGVEDYEDI